MKNLKRISGFLMIAVMSLAFNMTANAEVTRDSNAKICKVTDTTDLTTALGYNGSASDAKCEAIEIDGEITIASKVDFGDRTLIIGENGKVTVNGGELVFTNTTTTQFVTGSNMPRNYAIVLKGANSALNITNGGKVNITGNYTTSSTSNTGGITGYNGSAYYQGTVTVSGEGSALNITKMECGMQGLNKLDIKDNGSVKVTNSMGFGITGDKDITLNNGNLTVTNGVSGVKGKITSEGDSTITVTGNTSTGITLVGDSNIGGTTKVNATGNATSSGKDISLDGNAIISSSANVTATKIGSVPGENNKLTVTGAGVVFEYETVDESAGANVDFTQGVVINNNTITVKGDVSANNINVAKGQELVIEEDADATKLTISAEEGAILLNKSAKAVNVKVGDDNLTLVKNNSNTSSTVETIKITLVDVDGEEIESFEVLKGKALKDIALDEYRDSNIIKQFLMGKKTIDLNDKTPLNADTKITVVYKDVYTVTIEVDGEAEDMGFWEGSTVKDIEEMLSMSGVEFLKITDKDGKELKSDVKLTDGMYVKVVSIEAVETLDPVMSYVSLGLISLGTLGFTIRKTLKRN